MTQLGKNFYRRVLLKGWEVNGDVDLSNYYLVADIGSWAKDLTVTNGNYNNSGAYFRAGVDINLLANDPDKNMFFFGFRVGHSQFRETLSYQSTSPLFSPMTYQLSNGNVKGDWAELTTGLRVKVWKGFWMGYTARMKFAASVKGNNPGLIPFDMPGYGIIHNSPWWGFNYQVFWRFNWKKDVVIPIKK